MKSPIKLGICLIAGIGMVACSSHIEAPRKAAADLEGSAAAGMTYIDFGQKLQALGSAIALAKREGATENALRPYTGAFEIYKDSLDLWELKIDCPAEFAEGDGCRAAVPSVAETVQALAAKYGVPYGDSTLKKAWVKSDFGGPAVYTYPNVWEVRSANRAVFQKLLSTIWDKADKKSKEGG